MQTLNIARTCQIKKLSICSVEYARNIKFIHYGHEKINFEQTFYNSFRCKEKQKKMIEEISMTMDSSKIALMYALLIDDSF